MIMIKAKLVLLNKTDTESILRKYFSSGSFSSGGIFIKKIALENRNIAIFIAEAYYLRINSTLAVTAIVEETADLTTVEIISSGGKTSMGFSYGAEKNAVDHIVRLLKENGFTEQ